MQNSIVIEDERGYLNAISPDQHAKNLAHHQRRNDLLINMEGENITKHSGVWVFQFRDPNAECLRTIFAEDLRIIADELDRRNKQ